MVFCNGVSVVIRFRIIRSVLRKCGLWIVGCSSVNCMLPFMFSGLFP